MMVVFHFPGGTSCESRIDADEVEQILECLRNGFGVIEIDARDDSPKLVVQKGSIAFVEIKEELTR